MKILTFTILLAGIILLAVISTMAPLMGRNADYSESSSLYLANIEALTDTTSMPKVAAPDPENYIPNRCIQIENKDYTVECKKDGILKLKGKTIKGNFKRGRTYDIKTQEYNCDQIAEGAWCDKRMIKTNVMTVNNHKK